MIPKHKKKNISLYHIDLFKGEVNKYNSNYDNMEMLPSPRQNSLSTIWPHWWRQDSTQALAFDASSTPLGHSKCPSQM